VITIRVLRELVGRNVVQSHTLHPGEEFLARELTPFEHRVWSPYFGRELPRGSNALVVYADSARISTGELVVVGVDGADWEVIGTARVE